MLKINSTIDIIELIQYVRSQVKLFFKALFTFSIVFPAFVCMPGRVTLAEELPYLLRRVTLLLKLTFYHLKGRGGVINLSGLSFDYRISVEFAPL